MDNLTPTQIPPNNTETEQDTDESEKPFWKQIVEIGQRVPIEEWNKLPKDFARNAKHYMYGAPREEDYEE
jgi:hypothetical protein